MNQTAQKRYVETRRYAIVGAVFGFMFPVIATIVQIMTRGLTFSLANAVTVQSSDPLLWIIDSAPFFLGLFASFAGLRQDNLQLLNRELGDQGIELEKSRQNLEERVKDRTVALEQSVTELQFVASSARAIAMVKDLDSLLPQIVRLVTEHFGYYRTAIYLLAKSEKALMLQAETINGQETDSLAEQWVPVDTTTLVGDAVILGKARIISDISADSTYLANTDLPEARAEMGIPLRIRDQVIGVLDLHSTKTDAFSSEAISLLTILADQISVAIENARLFGEAKSALAESQATMDKYVRQEWQSFVRQSSGEDGYVYDGRQVIPLSNQAKSERTRNLAKTGSLSLDSSSANVTVPIKLRGQTIGMLEVRPKKGHRQWTDDEFALLEAAADRAAFALENARLVEGAQRRAARERAIGEISGRIGGVSERNLILQTAVEALGRKLGNTEIVIEMESQA